MLSLTSSALLVLEAFAIFALVRPALFWRLLLVVTRPPAPLVGFLVALIIVIPLSPAMAATSGGGIDVAPLINLAFQILEIVAPAALTMIIGWAVQRWGVKLNAETKATLQTRLALIADRIAAAVLTNAEHIAVKSATETGPMTTGNAQVDQFGNLLVQAAPDLLKKLGIDLAHPSGEGIQAIERLALARIPDAK